MSDAEFQIDTGVDYVRIKKYKNVYKKFRPEGISSC